MDRDFLPGLSVPRKWKDCQLILLCSLLGLTATHPLQTKAPVSCRELGRSGQVGRQLPLSWACLDQIPWPGSFAFHFVWINFTLPHDSHFLSRLQIPEPEGPSREECRLIPLTCLLLRVRAGKIHIFRLHLYPSIYFFFNMSLCLFIQDCHLSGGLASLQDLMHQGQVASKAAVIFLLSSHNSMGYPGEV